MKIALNRLHYPITTLGYGQRVGLWVQGCSIRCPGCVSKDTWERHNGNEISVEQILETCRLWFTRCDGITISGGEPFDQPDALFALLTRIRSVISGDVIVFSGYRFAVLEKRHELANGLIDVLITEPYSPSAGQTLVLRGSDNQQIHLLTHLARERYPADINKQLWEADRKLDVVVDGSDVWMVGIPEPEWSIEFHDKLIEKGLTCRTSVEQESFAKAPICIRA
jgi:anaerobic ribonucleoside-triphosphate reductase activating protein